MGELPLNILNIKIKLKLNILHQGKLSEDGPASNTLQNVKLTIYEPNKCIHVYPDKVKNWKSQICGT
jgi:hypothetical protein